MGGLDRERRQHAEDKDAWRLELCKTLRPHNARHDAEHRRGTTAMIQCKILISDSSTSSTRCSTVPGAVTFRAQRHAEGHPRRNDTNHLPSSPSGPQQAFRHIFNKCYEWI